MTPGQELTAHFVDTCRARGEEGMARTMKGQVAQQAKRLLDDGCSLAELKEAITLLVERRHTHAMGLGELVLELDWNRDPDPARRPAARKYVTRWLQQNGWPTGARFVRGSHSGHLRYDPLGRERITESGWRHARPEFDEIVRAMAENGLLAGVEQKP